MTGKLLTRTAAHRLAREAEAALRPLAEIAPVSGYAIRRARGPDATRVVIVFAPSERFILGRHPFRCDAIFVADETSRYYLKNARPLAEALLEAIEADGYSDALLLGSSKGGFGALSTARMFAEMRPVRTFHAIAFAPRVRLFPPNADIATANYRKLYRMGAKHGKLGKVLRRYGDVSFVGDLPNVVSTVVHATRHAVDMREAARFHGPNVSLLPIVGAAHNTIPYLLMHDQDEAEVRARVGRMYARLEGADRSLSLPPDSEQFIRDVLAARHSAPALNDLIDAVFATEPAQPSTGWAMARFARAARRFGHAALYPRIALSGPRWELALFLKRRRRAKEGEADAGRHGTATGFAWPGVPDVTRPFRAGYAALSSRLSGDRQAGGA